MTDVRIEGPAVPRQEEVLTPEALEFVGDLHARFAAHRDALLAARAARRAEIAAARRIDVRPETADVRDGDWRGPPPPPRPGRRPAGEKPAPRPPTGDYPPHRPATTAPGAPPR